MIAGASRPPHRLGKVIPARSAAACTACQAFAVAISSGPISPRKFAALAQLLSLAFTLRKFRTSARKIASSVVSLKSNGVLPRGIRRPKATDESIHPMGSAANRERENLRAPIEQVAIEIPGETGTPMNMNVLCRGKPERLDRGNTGRCGGERKLWPIL